MDESVVAAIAVSSAALAACAVVAVMFWRGSWLFLLAGNGAANGDREEDCRKLGRRAAVMLLVGCALLATLIVFEAAGLARNVVLASAASFANNVAFLALVVAVIWFFLAQRPDDDGLAPDERRSARPRNASLDHVHAATIVFVIAFLAVIAVVGIVAAGV